MLSIQLKSGEYLTIGNDIVVQVFQAGAGFRVAVEAPREMPVVRGEVLERTGIRPDCIHERSHQSPSRSKRDQQRFQTAQRRLK